MLSRPDSAFVARVAGAEFSGREFDHEPGFYVRGVEGLLLGGSTSYEKVASGVGDGDGEYDSPNVRTDPRIITLSGFVYGRSMWELGQLLIQLSGLLARRGDSDWFEWEEFGQQFRAEVRRGADSPARRRGSTGLADYTIRFRAPSQRVYGKTYPAAGPGSSIVLRNRGNFTTLPVLEVTGTMPSGYTLAAGPGRYVVTQALAAGQTHRIDMRNRVLFRNGSAQSRAVSRADALGIPPASRRTFSIEPVSGAGQLTSASFDTFI